MDIISLVLNAAVDSIVSFSAMPNLCQVHFDTCYRHFTQSVVQASSQMSWAERGLWREVLLSKELEASEECVNHIISFRQ